ncbi:MAG: FAD binding domain-containing protein, partial [Xanthobacteraceae bacterium]
MKPFAWIEARSVGQAATLANATAAEAMVAALGETPPASAAVLKAGGIDLLDLMKEGLIAPARIVNLRTTEGLGDIVAEADGGLRIGATATLARIGGHDLVRARYPALAAAAAKVASPQIRQVATLAGNLLQRPRCWYFRSALHHCARKGGETCFAFAGENQYHAIYDHEGCAIVHPSSVTTALVALGATIRISNAQGAGRMSRLEDFFVLPADDVHHENSLRSGEVVTAIVLPATRPTTRSVYLKQGEKDACDWPLADVAVVLDIGADGTCAGAAIVLGAAAPIPHRARAAEALLVGHRINRETAEAAARAELAGAIPLSGNAYKL